MCPKSYALGRWRGDMNREWAVALAECVCVRSYTEGYKWGTQERFDRMAARRSQGRR